MYLFNYHNIEIDYICDNNKENWGEIHFGIPIISPMHLEHLFVKKSNSKSNDDIVVQIAVDNSNIFEKLKKMGLKKIILLSEALTVLTPPKIYNLSKNNPQIVNNIKRGIKVRNFDTIDFENTHDYINNNFFLNQLNFICLIPKLGDITLQTTFYKYKIPHNIAWHSPEKLDFKLFKQLDKKVKIITGVREPISQNLSWLYQRICQSGDKVTPSIFLRTIIGDDDLFKNGGDAQELFDLMYQNKEDVNSINNFFERFKSMGFDLSKYPFDKEKGYTIVIDGNIEIFIYQLEKLNNIAKEMSSWIGGNQFEEWNIANEASNKWIANSYKQAQKEIQITQEHFDLCFDDLWVKHFYSEEDIEKFKARWRPHIRKE